MDPLLLVNAIVTWIVIAFQLLLILALIRKISPKELAGLRTGIVAPQLSLTTSAGQTYSLNHFIGKETLLIVISPHCTPCLEALPKYKELYERVMDSNIQFFFVSIENQEKTQPFIEENDLDKFPFLFAPMDSNAFMKDYKIPGTPFFVLIDTKGKIKSTGYPVQEWDEWANLTKQWNSDLRNDSNIPALEGGGVRGK